MGKIRCLPDNQVFFGRCLPISCTVRARPYSAKHKQEIASCTLLPHIIVFQWRVHPQKSSNLSSLRQRLQPAPYCSSASEHSTQLLLKQPVGQLRIRLPLGLLHQLTNKKAHHLGLTLTELLDLIRVGGKNLPH